MRSAAVFKIFSLAFFSLTSLAYGQDLTQGPPDLATLRRLQFLQAEGKTHGPISRLEALAKTWTLDTKVRVGTYGIDLSHYETDPCSVDLSKLPTYGLRYAYLETTRGLKTFNSVLQAWTQLASLHASKTLFRGAYHFLMPLNPDGTGNATDQANTFLQSIGAVGNNKPIELPPIVDIEPTNTPVTPGTDEYKACKRLTTDTSTGKQYCDMWYKMNQTDIVTMAVQWADTVRTATGQNVIVYSSPGAWDQVIGPSPNGKPLLGGRAIWLARYTSGGPTKPPNWPPGSWNAAANMPTLLDNTPYPSPVYNVPDFWQFSRTGSLTSDPFKCANKGDDPMGKLDFSFVPVTGTQFETVFGVQ
jgi:GH25 family lysozyme M1 (1,4-beta-N-acetylmuramidase)